MRVFNVMSIVFLILTVAVICCTVTLMSGTVKPPAAFSPRTAVPLPTLQVIPSLQPTATFTATATILPPTWTPEGGSALSNPASQDETATPEVTP